MAELCSQAGLEVNGISCLISQRNGSNLNKTSLYTQCTMGSLSVPRGNKVERSDNRWNISTGKYEEVTKCVTPSENKVEIREMTRRGHNGGYVEIFAHVGTWWIRRVSTRWIQWEHFRVNIW